MRQACSQVTPQKKRGEQKMSTRGCIARVGEHEGTFTGVYNHSDSYPRYMGPHLWKMLHEQYAGNLSAMLREIIDQHSAGWSFVGKECYCHPERDRDPDPQGAWITHENVRDSDAEWLWVFDEVTNRLYIRDQRHGEDVAIVDLNGPEPDWAPIECGENLERCHHYAWYHFPELKGSNLSTEVYLGRREFELHDAVAFIVNGKRYASTGCGGRGDFMNRNGKSYPCNCWVQSVKAANGRRLDVPVAKITKEGYAPYSGVTWVFPPTKDNPNETLKS
jgi:hypothetical protein